eukprot:TRINITY_DN9167_c0_g1_i2.p1 TRINITY_DN9167_c0_g1~~TRINITY_DN9167_c0_g1_i2.p1  ORF type:complete len:235 (-),score=0.33 TRINITY_DN9167_c0_g1_i2:72-776(-)
MEKVATFGSQGSAAGQLHRPYGLTVDRGESSSLCYVADTSNNRVAVFECPNGTFVRHIGSGHLAAPYDVAICPRTGHIFVSEDKFNRISVFTPDGSLVRLFGHSDGPEKLSRPRCMVFDGQGSLFVVDRGNCRVVTFSDEGQYIREFGRKGEQPGELNEPVGIAWDGDQHRLYVSEWVSNRVSCFTEYGQFVECFGNSEGSSKTLRKPWGMRISPNFHAIVVADSLNNRIVIYG